MQACAPGQQAAGADRGQPIDILGGIDRVEHRIHPDMRRQRHLHQNAINVRIGVQGRDLGFDGKTLIHPGQLAAANRVYGVSETEAQAARDLLQAWQEAEEQGLGVVQHAGRMIEELHARLARSTLGLWEAEQRDE